MIELPAASLLEKQQQNRFQAYVLRTRKLLESDSLQYWSGHPSVQIKSAHVQLRPLAGILFADSYRFHNKRSPLTVKQFDKMLTNIRNANPFKGQAMAMVGLPSSITPLYVCEFLGPFLPYLDQVRVVACESMGTYCLFMKFTEGILFRLSDLAPTSPYYPCTSFYVFAKHTVQLARSFWQQSFGMRFNTLQSQRIMLREIVGVYFEDTFDSTIVAKKSASFGLLSNIGFMYEPQYVFESYPMSLDSVVYNTQILCPLCKQEILSDRNINHLGMFVGLCGHFFHADCVVQKDCASCPECTRQWAPQIPLFCSQCNVRIPYRLISPFPN